MICDGYCCACRPLREDANASITTAFEREGAAQATPGIKRSSAEAKKTRVLMVLFRTILHYISIARDSRSLVHSYFFSTFLHFFPFFQPNISSFSLAWVSYLAKPGLRSASESAALALLSRFLADDHAPALGSRDGPLVLASSIYLSIAKANFATVAPIADFSVEDKRIDKRIGNRIDKTYRWSLFSAPQEALAVKPKRGGPRDWIAFSPH